MKTEGEDSCQRKQAESPGQGFSKSSQREPTDSLTLDFWPQGCERADTPCCRHLLCGAVSSSPRNWDVPEAEMVRASPHQMLRNAGQPSSSGEPVIGPDWAGRFPFPERRLSRGRKRSQASRRLQNQPQDLEIAGRWILFFLHEDKTLFTFTGTPCKGEAVGARAPGGGYCRGGLRYYWQVEHGRGADVAADGNPRG